MAAKAFRTVLLLAPLALGSLLATERPAQAVLTYYIYESGGNVEVAGMGSLILPSASAGTDYCWEGSGNTADSGVLRSNGVLVCTGLDITDRKYQVSGPTAINGTVNTNPPSGIASGLSTYLSSTTFVIQSSYISGNPITTGATFSGTTLAALGFTATVPTSLGTWTLQGDGGGDTITIVLGAPPAPSAAAPSPLPLLGASAAFGFSRRLRRRLNHTSAGADPAGSLNA